MKHNAGKATLPCGDHVRYDHAVQFTDGYLFSWTLNKTLSTITAQVDVSCNRCWVGFGLRYHFFINKLILLTTNSDYAVLGVYGMAYADIIVGIFTNNKITVEDYYRNAAYPGAPSQDDQIGGQGTDYLEPTQF